MTPEGDQATFGFDGLSGGLRGISTCRDKSFISPDLPQELVRVPVAGFTVVDTSDTRFNGVKICKLREPLLRLGDEV